MSWQFSSSKPNNFPGEGGVNISRWVFFSRGAYSKRGNNLKMRFIPKKVHSEASVQAEFYRQCLLHGINVYLEYKHKNCRFDAIIHDGEYVLAIVEVKSYKRVPHKVWNKKQMAKYKSFNLPVFLVTGMDSVPDIISQIREHVLDCDSP